MVKNSKYSWRGQWQAGMASGGELIDDGRGMTIDQAGVAWRRRRSEIISGERRNRAAKYLAAWRASASARASGAAYRGGIILHGMASMAKKKLNKRA